MCLYHWAAEFQLYDIAAGAQLFGSTAVASSCLSLPLPAVSSCCPAFRLHCGCLQLVASRCLCMLLVPAAQVFGSTAVASSYLSLLLPAASSCCPAFRLLCGCTFLPLLRVFMPLPCLLPQLLASSPLFCCFASPAAPPCSSQAQSAGSVYMPCGCTHKCTKRGASRHQESAKGKSNERQLEATVVEPRAGQQKPAEGKSNGM